MKLNKLTIIAPPETLAALAPLVREGVGVEVAAGRSLRRTLTDDLGLCPECVEQRIQTVFLDGSPVDDIDADAVRPGSTLALAGALPGVAGIAMQRHSMVGVFREGVTHAAGLAPQSQGQTLHITLKFFNTVAEECLLRLLDRGAEIRQGRLAELLDAGPLALAGAAFRLDGAEVGREALAGTLRGSAQPIILEARP